MPNATLRLIQTTDLHMQVTGFDYLADKPGSGGSLARLSGEISRLRQEGPTSLLFDCGDTFQGTPLADALADALADGVEHPLAHVMNDLKYDAITPGNHDLDFGLDVYQRAIKPLTAPIVCANLRSAPTVHSFAPWAVLERELTCDDGVSRPVRVGVIGFLPPQSVDWAGHSMSAHLVTDDILAAARSHLPALKRAGADLIVALSHSGFGPFRHEGRMENALIPLAAVAEFDAILAGHTHDVFPGPEIRSEGLVDARLGTVADVPTVMAGSEGSHLGVIDLTLKHDGEGWQVIGHDTRAISATDLDPSPAPAIIAPFAEAHRTVRAQLSEIVATTGDTFNSFFSCIGHDPSLSLIASAFVREIEDTMQGTDYAALPVLASVSTFRAGGHGGPDNYLSITDGHLRQRHLSAMLPFNAPICAVLRRGWQLRQWLEHCAAFFRRLTPDQSDQILIDPRFPPYQFDWIHGLNYSFDLSHPALYDPMGQLLGRGPGRVRDMTFEGRAVADDDLFVVATSIYRARGGGPQQAFNSDDVLITSDQGATEILRAHLRADAQSDHRPDPVWRFAPMPGTSADFLSSPAAAKADLPAGVRHLGPTEDGFHRFRITL